MAYRSRLIPEALEGNKTWLDMLEQMDSVFKDIDTSVEDLGRLRQPIQTDGAIFETANKEGRLVNIGEVKTLERALQVQLCNMLGFTFKDTSVLTAQDYMRIATEVGRYYAETKGTPAWSAFFGFCLNAVFDVRQLWTQDYVNFVEEADAGTPIWITGGTWYPTTHVKLVYESDNFDLLSENAIRAFFYYFANINLVLNSIEVSVLLRFGLNAAISGTVHTFLASDGIDIPVPRIHILETFDTTDVTNVLDGVQPRVTVGGASWTYDNGSPTYPDEIVGGKYKVNDSTGYETVYPMVLFTNAIDSNLTIQKIGPLNKTWSTSTAFTDLVEMRIGDVVHDTWIYVAWLRYTAGKIQPVPAPVGSTFVKMELWQLGVLSTVVYTDVTNTGKTADMVELRVSPTLIEVFYGATRVIQANQSVGAFRASRTGFRLYQSTQAAIDTFELLIVT